MTTSPLKPCSPTARSHFRERSRRIGDRQRREPEEARRMAFGSPSARAAFVSRATAFASSAVELFDAGRRQRQRLHVDARSIHRRDAAVADIEEFGDQVRQPAAGLLGALLQLAAGPVHEGGRGEVLFEGDRAHRAGSFGLDRTSGRFLG